MSPIVVTLTGEESLVLDGLALNNGVTYTLEAFDDPPPPKLPEWITGAGADGASLSHAPSHGPRIVTMRVRVEPQATANAAAAAVGALVDKLQEAEKGGVDLVRTVTDSTNTGTLKVLMGEITSVPVVVQGDDAGWFVKAPVATMTLTCEPFYRLTEYVAYGPITEYSSAVADIEFPGATGDVAGLARIIVTDLSSQPRRLVRVGLESLQYSTTAAPALFRDSAVLDVSSYAGVDSYRAGAWGPANRVLRAPLFTSPSAICGTGNLSHVGSFRVFARVWATAATTGTVFARLVWQDGDGPLRANPYATPVVTNNFAELDLGVVSVDATTLGTQRWTGRIEAYSTATGETLDIDYIYLLPTEGYGQARGAYVYTPGPIIRNDQFIGIAGGSALNGRVAPSGETWATSGGATDFAGGTNNVIRSTASDASGRTARLGATTLAATEVRVTVSSTGPWSASQVVARYVDASNFLFAQINWDNHFFLLYSVVGGVVTELAAVNYFGLSTNAAYQLRLVAFPSGRIFGDLLSSSGALLERLSATVAAAATGGVIATGKPGFADYNPSATTGVIRSYSAFYVATPPPEPIACHSAQSIEFRHDGILREDPTGVYYGAAPESRAGVKRIPVAGVRNRKVRLGVVARRNDTYEAADDQVADNVSIQVNVTPLSLVIPR